MPMHWILVVSHTSFTMLFMHFGSVFFSVFYHIQPMQIINILLFFNFMSNGNINSVVIAILSVFLLFCLSANAKYTERCFTIFSLALVHFQFCYSTLNTVMYYFDGFFFSIKIFYDEFANYEKLHWFDCAKRTDKTKTEQS